MSFNEDGYFQYSTVLSPLNDSLATSVLAVADPVLYQVTRYTAGIIEEHLGDIWNAVVPTIGLPALVNNVVAQVVAYDPLPIATENGLSFPLLAAYRKSESYKKETITWFDITSQIDILYILPPLNAPQGEALYPLLTHISRVVSDRFAQGVDSFYQDGYQPWAASQLNHIGAKSAVYGKFPGLDHPNKSNIWFPGIVITVEMSERSMPVQGNLNFKPLTTISGNVFAVPNPGDEPEDGIDIADFIADNLDQQTGE